MKNLKETIMISALSMLFAGSLSSCGDKKEIEDENTAMILGKWKLVFIADRKQTMDYSQHNIVYEFKANNILTVSGKADITDDKIHENGKHSFKVILPPPMCKDTRNVVGQPVRLKINTTYYNLGFGNIAPFTRGLQILSYTDHNLTIHDYTLHFSVHD